MFSSGGYLFSDKAVSNSPEFHRVAALPRRSWDLESATALADLLTPLLAKPGGTQKLRPVQAQALHDAGICMGGFFPIRVGGGKTLTSLLVAYVMGLRRPLLLVPASLKTKTKKECAVLCKHWRIPFEIIRIESYEQLSTPQSKDMLLNYQPDGIIVDEAQRLKNPKATCTKRVAHFMKENPATIFVAMSGTITKRSLKDYAHILKWCLKSIAPLPNPYNEMEDWAQALDEKQRSIARVHPGALLQFATQTDYEAAEGDEVRAARLAFRRRLTETPGVVSTVEGYQGASIILTAEALTTKECSPHMEGAFAHLRSDGLTPDDWPLTDAMSIWRHARELALGFYYRWNPRPPPEWLLARKVWYTHLRDILKHGYKGSDGRPLDSDFIATKALKSGQINPEGALEAYNTWKIQEDRPDFTPHTEAVWIDDTIIRKVAEWLKNHPRGIAWVEHQAFGERLSAVTGLPFFARQGKDPYGLTFWDPHINPDGYKGACIASVQSNSVGRNLQWAWSDNYIVSCPPNGLQWEQLLGRENREGQESDEINVQVLLACVEHYDALERALSDARYIEDSTGQAQQLLYADVTMPERWDMMGLPSRRYQR